MDLRHVNFFVIKSKIKFEDAQSMLNCFIGESSSNLWAYSFDISLGIIILKFTPHIKDLSGFHGFSMVFVNISSLLFCPLVFLRVLTFSLKLCVPLLSIGVVKPSALWCT